MHVPDWANLHKNSACAGKRGAQHHTHTCALLLQRQCMRQQPTLRRRQPLAWPCSPSTSTRAQRQHLRTAKFLCLVCKARHSAPMTMPWPCLQGTAWTQLYSLCGQHAVHRRRMQWRRLGTFNTPFCMRGHLAVCSHSSPKLSHHSAWLAKVPWSEHERWGAAMRAVQEPQEPTAAAVHGLCRAVCADRPAGIPHCCRLLLGPWSLPLLQQLEQRLASGAHACQHRLLPPRTAGSAAQHLLAS